MKYTFIVLVWFISLFIVNKLSFYVIQDRTSYEIRYSNNVTHKFYILPWLNFDGRNYLDIAGNGYFQKGIYNLRAFFPIYPLTIKIFSQITKINLIYSGLIISFMFTLASIYALCKLSLVELGKKESFKSVILLLTFPTSFFLISYYNESMYLFFILMCFLFLRKKNFLLSSIFAALASGTKIIGLCASFIVIYEAVRLFHKNRKFIYVSLVSPMGFILYSLYNWLTVNDPLVFLKSWTVWQKSFSLFGFTSSFFIGIKNVVLGPQAYFDSPYVYPISILEFLSLVFLILVIILSYKKISFIYWLFMILNSFFFLSGGILQSLPRYLLIVFPIYFYLLIRMKGFTFILYNVISFIALLFLSALFLRGYWVA